MREKLTVALAANFTALPLSPNLAFWWEQLDLAVDTHVAPYNQVFQSLLGNDGPLAENRRGANVVLIRLSEWIEDDDAVTELAAAVRASADKAPVPHLLVSCPASPAEAADPRVADAVAEAERHIAAAFATDARIRVITTADLAALYPVTTYFDDYSHRTAHVPYTPLMFAALASAVARAVHAWLSPRPKVIAVDADNTLWAGVVGEDGVAGIQVTPEHRQLQEFLVEQRAAGRLICLCSKNREADVLTALTEHPDMVLRPTDLTAHRINWEPKSTNLVSLADELGLGLDSFVFVDDNVVECAEVSAACPQVRTLPLLGDPAAALRTLYHYWPFDHTQVTAEDRERADRYQQERARIAARADAPSLERFLRDLDVIVEVRPMQRSDIARTAQLTERTNQFNLTTIRRSPAELGALDPDTEVLVVDVQDRFGAYGQVGAVVLVPGVDTLQVESFLLSCRVLGRGVEHQILNALGALALERGRSSITLSYRPTSRNQPALDFLTSLPAERIPAEPVPAEPAPAEHAPGEDHQAATDFRIAVPAAIAVRYRPVSASPSTEHTGPDAAWRGDAVASADHPPADGSDAARALHIATRLTTPDQVLAAIAAQHTQGTAPSEIETNDWTEAQVARIWGEILEFPPTSVHDNFHELGGHSLALVRFAARVRDEFGVELPIDALFTDAFTVTGIAATIRDQQLTGLDTEELDALLAELEQLSDDEVQALLDSNR